MYVLQFEPIVITSHGLYHDGCVIKLKAIWLKHNRHRRN